MCNNPWLIDAILYLPRSAGVVLAALSRSTNRTVSREGKPGILCQHSVRKLSKITHLSISSVSVALQTLLTNGLIARSNPVKPNTPPGYLILLEWPPDGVWKRLKRGVRLAEHHTEHLINDDDIKQLNSDIDISTPSPPGGVRSAEHPDGLNHSGVFAQPNTLVSALLTLGFNGAESFVARYPAERIEAALAVVEASGEMANPAGFLRTLVESGEPIPQPTPTGKDPDRYIKGKYGHLVKR